MDAIARRSADAGPATTTALCCAILGGGRRRRILLLPEHPTLILCEDVLARDADGRPATHGQNSCCRHLPASFNFIQFYGNKATVVAFAVVPRTGRRLVTSASGGAPPRRPRCSRQRDHPPVQSLWTARPACRKSTANHARCDASSPTYQIHVARSVLFPPDVVVARHRIQY